ncbi:MAG: enoyl-CoA hydratase/isomerase family protein [Deltaproteobacteria bacterium]|nr:enoyl-CoA hydratase/isomerase family protein [Deltaproteobacteria bacterium]
MSYQHIKTDHADGMARITLARPKHNVLNIEMMNELNAALSSCASDMELKCVVLSGEGPSWCAGVDVGEHHPAMVAEMMAAFNGIFENMEKIDVPLIAAVHGACLGGGMELAIACDIIVASSRATFGQPEIRLGFFPPYAAIRLPQLVGTARTIEICATGKIYSADEAKAMGMISQVAGEEAFGDAVQGVVGSLLLSSPLIIRLSKQAVKRQIGMAFPQALAGVTDLFLNRLMKTEDTLEGINSFGEKRKPVWKNR